MGGNFIFHSSGMRSPFGSAYVSGSHCGNKAYWAGTGGSSSTYISVKNYGSDCCSGNIFGGGYGGCYGDYYGGYYGGGGCCHGGGISEKGAWTALGIGAGIGLLASPLGAPILKGIGYGFKYLGLGFKYAGIGIGKAAAWTWNKAIKPAATWTWNNVLKPVGKGLLWGGKQICNAFAYIGKGFANWFTGKRWSTDNEWSKLK